MKNILIVLSLIFVLIAGCEEEDLTPKFTDISWRIGIGQFEAALHTTIDNHMTFMDLSINPASHIWEIDSGNFFLNSNFKLTDTAYNDFKEKGLTSTSKKANIVFKNAGLNNVRLYNTFSDSVGFTDEDGNVLLSTLNDNGEWEIDTTFVIDVYDYIKPAFKVYKGDVESGELILSITEDDSVSNESGTWPVVEIEKGEILTFVDETVSGRPNELEWRLNTGGSSQTKSTKAEATIYYTAEGTYKAGSLFERRVDPLPTGSSLKVIPLNISVIPCTQPGVFTGNMLAGLDDVISFSVSVPIQSFNSFNEITNFSIHVTNSEQSYDETYFPGSVTVDPTSNTTLLLTIPDGKALYEDDVIMVTYSGGDIPTDCGTALSAFGPELASVPDTYAGNIIDGEEWNHSFELGKDSPLIPEYYFIANNMRANLQRVLKADVGSVSNETEGDYMLRHSQLNEATESAVIRLQHDFRDDVALGAGDQYLIGFWIYVSSESDDALINLDANFLYALRNSNGGSLPVNTDRFNLDDKLEGKRDQWVFIEHAQTVPVDAVFNQIRMQYHPDTNVGTAVFYIDDLEVRRIDRRPE